MLVTSLAMVALGSALVEIGVIEFWNRLVLKAEHIWLGVVCFISGAGILWGGVWLAVTKLTIA